jgi:serine/threonine protein kinase
MPEIGQTMSHYRIVEKIGQGGMGEVYLADDTTLDRKVALKFLPEAFISDPERMARFEREAKLLASLNHPNIAGIYGLEQADGNRFLVLEYVEGKTLQARLSKGALPLEDALELCRQIAEGLEAAHEKGVIHRDLKPANVMITAEEKVKILDFGLAKALSDETQGIDSSQSPTLTEAITQPGVILGTAAYMSPEQAKGRSVDKRADIWAFGCILYECLTGKKAFGGKTVTETLAAVITKEPNWEKIPVRVRPLLQSCLKKDSSNRLRDIGDTIVLLESIPEAALESVTASTSRRKLWLAWSVGAVLLVAFAVSLFLYLHERLPTTAELMQFHINPSAIPSVEGSFALSPDGRYLAYAARGSDGISRLWIRAINSSEDRPLPGTESDYIPPFFWSPDSRFIAFNVGGTLKKINVSGSPPTAICELPAYAVGGSWNRDDVIILGILGEGIMRVDVESGNLSPITRLNQALNEVAHVFPVFLPDGRNFFYFCSSNTIEKTGIYLGSLDSKPEGKNHKQLQITGYSAVYVPDQNSGQGQLLFLQEQTLMAKHFDEKNLELIGKAEPLVDNVGFYMSFGFFSASTNGALFYRSVESNQHSQITLFDRQGNDLGVVGRLGNFYGLAFSPKGAQAALGWVKDPQNAYADVFILDFIRGIDTRFTFGQGSNNQPVWSPDGSEIIFGSSRKGSYNLYRKPVSATRDEELLFESNESKVPNDWSIDGRYLLYTSVNPKTRGDLWVLSLEDKKAVSILNTKFNEFDGSLSPDMRWIAYVSDESGIAEVYIRPFSQNFGGLSSDEEGKLQISKKGGTGPRWKSDSKELFYYAPDGKIMAVEISGSTASRVGAPKTLFQPPPIYSRVFNTFTMHSWDVSTDGKRFLLATQSSENSPSPFNVILNWQSLLEK